MINEQGAVAMTEEVSWLNHAVSAALAALGGFALIVGGAVSRLWGHEGRIKALEDVRATHATAIDDLVKKVDAHHTATAERIDQLGEGIRSDLRVILSRCLSVSHPERHE